MTGSIPDVRHFKVRARHEDSHHGRLVLEPTFEAAAIAYVEHLPHAPDLSDITIIVHEVESGHEHSFRIDLGAGEPRPEP